MRPLFLTFLLLAPAVLLPAQAATYTIGGTGCGMSPPWCLANNPQGGTLAQAQNSNIFALEVKPTTAQPVLVRGFELFTRANSTITTNTFLYDADSAGKPGKTLATGTIKIGTAAGWYATLFTTPVLVPPTTTKFFLSYTSVANTMQFPFLNRTGPGVNGVHYWHGPTSTTWSGPFTTQKWAWRVLCPGGVPQVPLIGNSGLPQLGNKMSVTLDQARASSSAVLTLGFSNTLWAGIPLPFDLTPLGGTGCSLFNAIIMIMPVTTGGTGQASLPVAIPNDPFLLGAPFYNQWIVVDPQANSLGLAFSAGGIGMIGK